jgi:hypothetical protein
MELPTDADDEVASWIAAGSPPIYFGFGSIAVESPADTLSIIGAACEQLGERALVGADWSDFSGVPQNEHVKVVSAVNFAAVFGACRATRWRGYAGRGPSRWSSPTDPVDVARSVAPGSRGQTIGSGCRPTLVEHYRRIASLGPSNYPGPAICRPGSRDRHPNDQTRRKHCGGRRPSGEFRSLEACRLTGESRSSVQTRFARVSPQLTVGKH